MNYSKRFIIGLSFVVTSALLAATVLCVGRIADTLDHVETTIEDQTKRIEQRLIMIESYQRLEFNTWMARAKADSGLSVEERE